MTEEPPQGGFFVSWAFTQATDPLGTANLAKRE